MATEAPTNSLPDRESADLARASAQELSQLLRERPESDRARVTLDGRDLILPRQALALLRDVLTDMAQGHAITIVPTHAELTTQQAADMLNVSRPYLVKLLESGEIEFTKTGSHRRIRYQDVVEYKNSQLAESKRLLAELAEQAQEDGHGY